MLGSAKDPYCWMVGAEELLDVLSKRLLQIMNWGQHQRFHNTIAPAAKYRLRSVVVFKRHNRFTFTTSCFCHDNQSFWLFQLNLKTFRTESLHHNQVHVFRTKKNSKNQQQPSLLNLCSSSLLYHYYICYYLPKRPRNVKFPIPSYPSLLDHRRHVAMFLQNLREIGRVWHLKSHDGFMGQTPLFQWPKIHRVHWGYNL